MIKGMDFITMDRIYSSVSQMPHDFLPVPEFSQIDNQMLLYSTNINSSINWLKRYDEMGWINAGFPLATSDGGCLWIGNYWDWHHKTHQDYDVIIMKINPDGTFFEGINESVNAVNHTIVYPNPGTDFEFSTNLIHAKLQIYNTTGNVVLKADVERGNHKIETSFLNEGVYFYQFIKNNRNVESGKWVKIKAQ
jgi:hypothetical protein